MSETRDELHAEKLEAYERWAERVKPEELQEADPESAKRVLAAVDDYIRAQGYASADEYFAVNGCPDADVTAAAARGNQAP